MSLTPFKSEWEWINVDRGLDYTVINGIEQKRNNWSLSRKRVSNDIYASEVDTRQYSLTAYNGGVPETVDNTTESIVGGLHFDTTTTWTLNTTIWEEWDYSEHLEYRYTPQDGTVNIPDSTKINACSFQAIDSSYTAYAWFVVEMEPEWLESPVRSIYSAYTNGIRSADTYTPAEYAAKEFPLTPDGVSFTVPKGTFVGGGSSTAEWGTVATGGEFLCTNDSQQYQQRGVEWYTQQQTWSFKDRWRVA